MERWEYTVWREGDKPLNLLGDEGWEVVGCHFSQKGDLAAALLKHRLEPERMPGEPIPGGGWG